MSGITTLTWRWRSSGERVVTTLPTAAAATVVPVLLRTGLFEWLSVDDGTQVCTACGERKERSAFYGHPGARNRHHYECRPCFDDRRARNRERQRASVDA